jgi:hypothetical protein
MREDALRNVPRGLSGLEIVEADGQFASRR